AGGEPPSPRGAGAPGARPPLREAAAPSALTALRGGLASELIRSLAVLWWPPNAMTRFGISLPTGLAGGPPFGAASLSDAARSIEAAGFESAWTFDSVGRGTLRPDPLMALAVAATVPRHPRHRAGPGRIPGAAAPSRGARAARAHHPSPVRRTAPLRGGRWLHGRGLRRPRPRLRRALSAARRVARHHAAPLGRRERGGRLPGARVARRARRAARAHRLLGPPRGGRAGPPPVRRLGRLAPPPDPSRAPS